MVGVTPINVLFKVENVLRHVLIKDCRLVR